MVGLIAKLFGGVWGYVIAGVNGALVAGYVAWRVTSWHDAAAVQGAQLRAEQFHAAMEKDRADANQATVEAIAKSVTGALNENAYLADAATKREARTAQLMETLSHVPKTVQCGSSPAFRAYLGGVLQHPAASTAPGN